MKLRHLGYACINVNLDLSTNSTFRLSNLSAERVHGAVSRNLRSLKDILAWNLSQGIYLFRIGSSFIPFASHEKFDYDWKDEFAKDFDDIRKYVDEHGLRLSMHPGQYTVLNSPNPKVVDNAMAELLWHAEVLDLLDPLQGTLVLHVGGAYGDKAQAIRRFADNYDQLPDVVKKYLVVENDDTTFNLDDALEVSALTEIPVVFDYFHHQCLYAGERWQDGLEEKLDMVVNSWQGKVPKLHISSQKEGSRTGHADFISQQDFEELQSWMDKIRADEPYDLMVEAKRKDKAAQTLVRRP